jgi:hypothetical protein
MWAATIAPFIDTDSPPRAVLFSASLTFASRRDTLAAREIGR